MADEQCSFEELSALLESDDDMLLSDMTEKTEDSAKEGTACSGDFEGSSMPDGIESSIEKNSPVDTYDNETSDDDIGEDELDKLAGLMEKSDEDEETGEVHVRSMQKPIETSKDTDGSIGDVSEGDESSNDAPDTAVMEELKRMQEKMALLEAQLKKKKAKDKSKSPKQPNNKTNCAKTASRIEPGVVSIMKQVPRPEQSTKSKVHIDTPRPPVVGSDGKSKVKSVLDKKVSPPKLQMLEEDIFSTDHDEINKSGCGVSEKEKEPTKVKSFYGGKSNSSNKPGNDSDSDWEGMDGEKPSELNKAGKEMKALLKQGHRDRVAHAASYERETVMAERQMARSWKEKPAKASTSYVKAVAGISAVASGATSKPNPVEKGETYGGIQVIKPLVSTNTFISMTDGRKLIKMSKIHCKTKSSDLQDDWITVGVIVNKSEPKMSSKGKQFSIWKMSDLDDCDITVSLFLFANVHTTHWKIQPGSVIGLLNPSILPNNDKYKGRDNDVSITLDAPQKLLLMGRSRDFGLCRGKTKAGKECLNFVNKSKGEYCTYHIQAAYKKQSAKRPDLQAGYAGMTPKSMEQRLLGNKRGQSIIYGGQSFSTVPPPNKAKDRPTIKSLQAFHTTLPASKKSKVNTLQLHELTPQDKPGIVEQKDEKNKNFHELMTVPSVGSMNYITHLKKSEQIKEKEKDKNTMKIPVKPKDLLLQHDRLMKEKRKQHQLAQTRESPGTPRPVFNGEGPKLGNGFLPGNGLVFDLDDMPPLQPKSQVNQDMVKQKALEKLKAKGGIKKEDPNAVKKNHQSSESKEKIRKRISENPEDEENQSSGSQPPKKKKKIGSFDLSSPDVQKLLKARSKYDGALTEMEEEKFEQYFDILEKTEKLEEKMDSIKEQKCMVFSCSVVQCINHPEVCGHCFVDSPCQATKKNQNMKVKMEYIQCNYTAFAPSQRCKEERHKVKKTEALKRFFQCKNCKNRTTHFDRLPPPCKNCGQQNFERVSMLRAKKGPKLPGEELVLRGEELKNLNSLM